MAISDLLAPHAVLPTLRVTSKKHALKELAERLAVATDLPARLLYETLSARERVGSTAVGRGIAIPHGRLAELSRMVGLFARLEKPIDFEALDGLPVDLVFVLLAPDKAGTEHLRALAGVARVLHGEDTAQKLRATEDAAALYALLTSGTAASAA